jgi:hypothetical protein
MSKRSVLSAADLQRILMRVIGSHADADGVICIDLRILRQLATDLCQFSPAEVSLRPETLPQLMASMATLIFAEGRTHRYIGERSDSAEALTRRIRADFTIECVVFFVRSCGYYLDIDSRRRDHLTLALLMPDWARVAEILGRSINRAAVGEGRSALLYEVDFDSYAPDEYAAHSFDRQLSAESYSNLVSEADDQQWLAVDVLMLIEEYLNPELRPDLVHHSRVVSSDEWHDLYDWLRRGDGYVL